MTYKFNATHMTPKAETGNHDARAPLALVIAIMMVTCALPLSAATANDASAPGATGRALPTDPKYIILTTVVGGDPYYNAVSALRSLRGGAGVQVLNFDPKHLDALLPALQSSQPRYAAVILKPTELDINFTRAFFMMSTKVDNDPFTDFSYGFITGATAQDAMNFVANIKKAETQKVQDFPLNWSGFSASSINAVYTTSSDYSADLDLNKYSMIYMEENDTGAGLQYFLANDHYLPNNKVLDIGNNGDPHMVWLFEGGNINPNPPSWPYDPLKVEDPAHARVGLTSNNLTKYNLWPAVAFNGACHSGETKTVMIESDIEATFGDTGGVRRFYTMSDNFSFALQLLKTNITGYFAPVGANLANEKDEELYNAFLYNEPLGDTAKRNADGVVMGFLGNRPNLTIYHEGESTNLPDIGPSGTFQLGDWPSADAMLGGKANRVYFGDPLYDPYQNDHSDKLRYTTTKITPVDSTHLRVDVVTKKPAGYTPSYWDMFHYGKTRIYVPVTLPVTYDNVTDVKVTGSSGPMEQVIHAVEWFDNKTILHLEIDLANDSFSAVDFNATFIVTVPEPPTLGVDILGNDIVGMALPYHNKSYQVQVKNTGNQVDDVLLSRTDLPSGWAIDVIFDGNDMAPGATRTAIVNMTVALMALAGENGTVELTAISLGNMSRRDYLNITTTTLAYYGVDITGLRLTGGARPGETKEFPVQISNVGNAMDKFDLNVTIVSGAAKVALENKTLDVAARDTAITIVSVTSPADAMADTNTTLTLKATSRGNKSRSDSILLVTFVDPAYAVDMTAGGGKAQSCSTAPRTSWTSLLTVTNLGNSPDTFDLKASRAPEGWTVTLNLDVLATVGPSMSDYANVTIKPPPDALAGSNVSIVVTVTSQGNTSVTDTVNLTTLVKAVPSAELVVPDDKREGPGHRPLYNFTVNNTGNAKDSYCIRVVSSMGWTLALSTNKTKELAPHTNTSFIAETIIPPKTLAYTIDTLTVTVMSVNFHGAGACDKVMASASVKTTVTPVYTLGLLVDHLTTSIHTNETATFTLTVQNLGNTRVKVNITIASNAYELPWANLSATAFELDGNTGRNVVFSVSPVLTAKAGNYTYSLTIVGENATQNVDLKVVVLKTKHEDKNAFARALLTLGLLLMLIIAFIAFYLSRSREKRPAEKGKRLKDDEDEGVVAAGEEE
jgi:uncharacterized membrane protein